VPVYLQLAGAYLDVGKEADALAAYGQIIKIVPQHVPVLNNLAWLNRDKAPKQALEYAQQAYQLAPRDPYVLDTLGMLTLKNGDVTQATNLLRNALAGAPTNPAIKLHLGRALVQQKNYGEAQRILEELNGKQADTAEAKEARTLLESFRNSRR
jgi:Tfp pilus assembly protein PilF